ncbi:hypothetical protein GQ53DRAFT_816962 [Thozetella sp. PMI_491]|nr:hypothetical protein GQ53DRAFT_816962 [Thozetella sp. PMI_491]
MHPSFKEAVVYDQVNNTAVIGTSNGSPGMAPDFIFWAILCVIWVMVFVGRFFLRVGRMIKSGHVFGEPNERHKSLIAYWSLLLLVWIVFVGFFAWRVKQIFDLRRWAGESGWMEDGGKETQVSGFGQFASIFSIAAIVLAGTDRYYAVKRETEE